MFSARPLSVHAELRIEKDFWSRTIGGKVGGGPVAPCARACEELKKLHRFRLCFVLLVNRSRAEGEAICKEKGASKLQESARQDENGSTFPLW